MLAKLKTFLLLGIDALPVEVEVDVSPAALLMARLSAETRFCLASEPTPAAASSTT